jgi:hypothetical protein
MKTVYVNRRAIRITPNLWDLLQVLAADGSTCTDQWFWADQISMNQNDVAERDHQVALMGVIFSEAETVFAWLGGMREEDLRFDIHTLAKRPTRNGTWILDPRSAVIDAEISTFAHLVRQKYWSRLWVVQELRLAQRIEVWYGHLHLGAGQLFEMTGRWPADCIDVGFEPEGTLSRPYVKSRDLMRMGQLLGPTSLDEHKQSLFKVLYDTCGTQCVDPRDRIYGVQALVLPSQRVRVDHTRSLTQTMHEAMRIMFLNLPAVYRSSLGWRAVRQSVSILRHIEHVITSSSTISDTWAWSQTVPCIARAIASDADNGLIKRPQLNSSWDKSSWPAVLKYATTVATTKAQKRFSKELEDMIRAEGFQDLWHSVTCDLERHWSAHGYVYGYICSACKDTPMLEMMEAFERMIDKLATLHGFAMYEGEFLSHPDDWPFPGEQPCKVFLPDEWRLPILSVQSLGL